MRRCVCPGSFDPPTHGHVDVVVRAAALFDEVVVAVVHNPAKAASWSGEERAAALREAVAEASPEAAARVRTEVVGAGLLVDLCARVGAGAVVKGVRGAADVEHEAPMAVMNRHLAGVETVLLVGDPRWSATSSSLVREVHALGGDVSALVPTATARRLGAPRASG